MVGGVKAKRLSVVEYETSIEVLNQYGESSCLKSARTKAREGAAGAFFNSGGERVFYFTCIVLVYAYLRRMTLHEFHLMKT